MQPSTDLQNFFFYFNFNLSFNYSIQAQFKSLLEELVSKRLDIAYKIIHLVLKYQKLGDVTIIPDAYVKLVNRKIIYFGLQENQPNFLGKR